MEPGAGQASVRQIIDNIRLKAILFTPMSTHCLLCFKILFYEGFQTMYNSILD